MNNQPTDKQAAHRILHITFNMGFGGTEQVIRQLVMHLPKDQFSNEILCIDGEVGEIGKRLETEQGITIHKLKRQPGLDLRLALNIRRLIKRGGFNIVHCHQYTPWFYGWLGSMATGVRLFFTEHGRFYPDRYRRKAWLINKLMARTTDAIVAISKATGDALVEYEYLPRKRIDVVYNGIEPLNAEYCEVARIRQELRLKPNALVIGTVARLDQVKNQSLILETFAYLNGDFENLYVLIVGDGPEREALEDRARRLGISQQVLFTGFIQNPERYMSVMDIFLLPSFTEGTSMTLLESMSLGVPCIVSKVGGNPEIITDKRTGRLFEIGKPEQFQEILNDLLMDADQRTSFSERAKEEFHERFSVSSFVMNYQNLYQKINR